MKAKLIRTLYKHLLKRIFFKFNPEKVHNFVSFSGKILGSNVISRKVVSFFFNYKNPSLSQEISGIRFINPVGLSAGFDKEAELIKIMPSVGFGFETVGSVTYEAYEGNPKPRLYRLKKSKALVVYYGLKNDGVKKIIPRILKSKKAVNNFPVCISIAKTNCERTKTDEAGINDYFETFNELINKKAGDFYEINISCPNTFGGEPFTTAERLEKLLDKLSKLEVNKPAFIKMPINLQWSEFDKLLKVIVRYKFITGVTIGNLNKDHFSKLVLDPIPENVKGGISGKPTFELSNNLILETYKNYGKRLKIIGVGGIFSADDAYEKIKRGACLVELITGMIYEGPQVIGEINRGLVELLKKDGYRNISEAVGKMK